MALVNSFAKFAAATYPAEASVASGVTYGDSNNAFTGSLNVDSSANVPAESEVLNGITFGSSNQFTGNVTQPAEGDVRSGVQFGANGTQFTGTLATSGNVTVPSVNDVLTGVTYGDQSAPIVGVFDVPQISDVRSGVSYGANGTQFTGSYLCNTYGIQNETKLIVRGDDAVLEWTSDGSWSAAGSILFGIVGSTGSLQVSGTVVDANTVRASLTSAQTDALRDVYEYDVQMTDAGSVSHLVEGSLIVRDTETDIPTNEPMPQGRAI
jgi:hypothetical protein